MYFRIHTGNKSFWVKNEINGFGNKKIEIKKTFISFIVQNYY